MNVGHIRHNTARPCRTACRCRAPARRASASPTSGVPLGRPWQWPARALSSASRLAGGAPPRMTVINSRSLSTWTPYVSRRRRAAAAAQADRPESREFFVGSISVSGVPFRSRPAAGRRSGARRAWIRAVSASTVAGPRVGGIMGRGPAGRFGCGSAADSAAVFLPGEFCPSPAAAVGRDGGLKKSRRDRARAAGAVGRAVRRGRCCWEVRPAPGGSAAAPHRCGAAGRRPGFACGMGAVRPRDRAVPDTVPVFSAASASRAACAPPPPGRVRQQHLQRRQHSAGAAAVHGHAEPTGGLFAGHRKAGRGSGRRPRGGRSRGPCGRRPGPASRWLA